MSFGTQLLDGKRYTYVTCQRNFSEASGRCVVELSRSGGTKVSLVEQRSGCRFVFCRAESHRREAACRLLNIPRTLRRAIYRNVGPAVAVVIAGNRHVAYRAECSRVKRSVLAAKDVPRAARRPEYGNVGLAVAGIIGRNDAVACKAELHRNKRAV